VIVGTIGLASSARTLAATVALSVLVSEVCVSVAIEQKGRPTKKARQSPN